MDTVVITKDWTPIPPVTKKTSTLVLRKKDFKKLTKDWHKSEIGRPLEFNIQDCVPKLIAAFQNDFSVEEACDYADVAVRTFYNHLKKNVEFAEVIRKAKEFPKTAAKNRVMTIINKGNDRDAGPMARWLLEKRVPEVYGSKLPSDGSGGQTQNNYFFLNNENVSKLTEQPDITNSDPSELLEALEAQSVVDS